MVWLSSRDVTVPAKAMLKSKKLTSRFFGPYKVERFDAPATVKLKWTNNKSKVWPYEIRSCDQPISSSTIYTRPPPPILPHAHADGQEPAVRRARAQPHTRATPAGALGTGRNAAAAREEPPLTRPGTLATAVRDPTDTTGPPRACGAPGGDLADTRRWGPSAPPGPSSAKGAVPGVMRRSTRGNTAPASYMHDLRAKGQQSFFHERPQLVKSLWVQVRKEDLPPGPLGIVGNTQTLHTLATYRRLRQYHTPPHHLEFTLPSVRVIIQGDFSVFSSRACTKRCPICSG